MPHTVTRSGGLPRGAGLPCRTGGLTRRPCTIVPVRASGHRSVNPSADAIKVRILDPPPSKSLPLTCDDRSGSAIGSDDRCPRRFPLYSAGHRCIWHEFDTTVASGLDLLAPFPPTRPTSASDRRGQGWRLRHRGDITQRHRWALFDMNADWLRGRYRTAGASADCAQIVIMAPVSSVGRCALLRPVPSSGRDVVILGRGK
jgi:hypothetical protein